ncbi:MAG: metal ABC transporter ATP-binding protein [Nanobdellota archaeon]
MEIISLEDVAFSYGRNELFKGVNLKVKNGEFLGLVGPNGGGKTTLVKIIMGLLRPTKGKVRVKGLPPEKGRRHLGYISQYEMIDFDYPITVYEVVIMARQKGLIHRFSRNDHRLAKDSLRKVGLLELKNRNINELSGGEKQRVFVARALATRPAALVMDEPMANVDIKIQEDFYKLMKKLSKDMAVVIVEHNLEVLAEYVDRVACVNKCSYHGLKGHDMNSMKKIKDMKEL